MSDAVARQKRDSDSILTTPPPIEGVEARIEPERIVIEADLPEGFYRCDLCTRDGTFDIDSLYIQCRFRNRRDGNIPDDPTAPVTGPWDYINDRFYVPVEEVTLDGARLGDCWFDLPQLEEIRRRFIHASFGFVIGEPGRHRLEVALSDPRLRGRDFLPPVLRRDERTPVRSVPLRAELIGTYPRLFFGPDDVARLRRQRQTTHRALYEGLHRHAEQLKDLYENTPASMHGGSATPRAAMAATAALLGLLDDDASRRDLAVSIVEAFIQQPHWGTGRPGSMGCDNDIAAGRCMFQMCCAYDWLHGRADADVLRRLEDKLRLQARRMYDFAVFQRDYWPTGYYQNHCQASLHGLLAVGALFCDRHPEAQTWVDFARRLNDGTMGRCSLDGGWIQADIAYGMQFYYRMAGLFRHAFAEDICLHPFFDHVFYYLTYVNRTNYLDADAFLGCVRGDPYCRGRLEERLGMLQAPRCGQGPADCGPLAYLHYQPGPTRPIEELPRCRHFADSGMVVMRTAWQGDDALTCRVAVAPPMAHSVTGRTARYEGGHAMPDQGSVYLTGGRDAALLCSGGVTYRKRTDQCNTLTVDGAGQWGEDSVWFPTLRADQCGRITRYEDTADRNVVEADLTRAYPPSRGLARFLRSVVFCKPDVFVVCDRLETAGATSFQAWFHTRGQIERVGAGLWRIAVGDRSVFVRDLLGVDDAPEVAATEVVPTYSWDGTFATHVRFNVPAAETGVNLLFVITADRSQAVSAAVERGAEALHLRLPDGRSVAFDARSVHVG